MFTFPKKNADTAAMPDIKLEEGRIILRPPVKSDWAQWAEVRAKNRLFLKPFEPTWPDECLSEGFFARRLARQAQNWSRDHSYAFLLFKKETPVPMLIGGININHICRGASQSGSIGYWLDESSQGHGYMREGLQCLIPYAFKKLDLHRINAACLPTNERSRKLLLGLGFREEGFAKAYVKINNIWEDHILFGLNREE